MCENAAKASSYEKANIIGFKFLKEGKDNWLFRTTTDLKHEFEIGEESSRLLGRFARALQQRGVQLVLVYQPTRGIMHGDKLFPVET